MDHHVINDIGNFIFVSDEPEKADAIFLPGGSHPAQPEYASELYHRGYAKWLIPSGGVSVKRDKWPGVVQRRTYTTAIIDPIANFLRMYS